MHFAPWPETYSYTLTESYMAKVPVLTFDIGAVGDRVRKDKLGWVIDIQKSEKILEKIKEISNNKEEYDKIKSNFDKYTFRTTKQMQKCYEEMYKKIPHKQEYDANSISSITSI